MSGLDDLENARSVTGASRLSKLRDAAEAIAEEVRATPVRTATHIVIDRLLVETRTVIPDARLVSPLVALTRRALLIVAADGKRILVDPSDAGPCTPYEERVASRHPMAIRALIGRSQDRSWPQADLVVSTSLALRSQPHAREALGKTRWIAPRAELEAAREPSPLDLPRYSRTAVQLEAVEGSKELAPGVLLIETPGPSVGHCSIAFCFESKVYVHTHSGVIVDAWSPYESSIPGLREAVRLRNVEAVIRGDVSDPTRAMETMTIERALADRRADRPAMFRVLPAMEFEPTLWMPRMRPLVSAIGS